MTIVTNANMTAGDSPRFALSIFFQIADPIDTGNNALNHPDASYLITGPNNQGTIPLAEWGFQSGQGQFHDLDTYSWLWVGPYWSIGKTQATFNGLPGHLAGGPPAGAMFLLRLSGRYNSSAHAWDGDLAGPPIPPNGGPDYPSVEVVAYVPGFDFTKPHHVGVFADLSQGDVGTFSFGLSPPPTVVAACAQNQIIQIVVDRQVYVPNFFFPPDVNSPIAMTWAKTGSAGDCFWWGVIAGSATPADAGGWTLSNPVWSIAINGLEFAVPCLERNAYQYAKIIYGPTQAWFGKYIDPSVSDNLDKLCKVDDDGDGNILQVDDGQAAADAFGTPDVWLVRDNVSGLKYEDNQGTAGDFTLLSSFVPPNSPPDTAPTIEDYSPSPFDDVDNDDDDTG